MMLSLAPFSDRSNFAPWLNELGLIGTAVEVGTHQGEFADQFLSMWQGEKLYCVDPWLSGYDPKDPASTGDRSRDLKLACSRLSKYGKRVVIDTKPSVEAAKSCFNESLDFVFVDANHNTKFVAEDLLTWWPKLKVGGVLAGHDILSPSGECWEEEVQPAVFNFAALVDRVVHLVPAPGTDPWSYYMVK